MTLEQLRVFVAVAEREHLTAGAKALHLTPSAATASIQALETRHGAKLFHRIGRRLELSGTGHAFLPEARAVLAAAQAAELALEEAAGDVLRGRLALAASQTLASYWLPPLLMRFVASHNRVAIDLREGNTAGVTAAVLAGEVEIGCIEGDIDQPALAIEPLADDRLTIVAALHHPLARLRDVPISALEKCCWVLREPGSGTRAVFETAMRAAGAQPDRFDVKLALPTNEAVCGAVAKSLCLTAVSELVARPHIEAGRLCRIDHVLPTRRFALVRHKERFRSKAAVAFEALLRQAAQELTQWQAAPTYDI